MRKAFNFYRSYYEVFLELPDAEKLIFIQALLDWQFTGKEPKKLKGMAKFALMSQKHSIVRQLEGYKAGKKTAKASEVPPKGTAKGTPSIPPRGTSEQDKEKDKGKEQEKEQGQKAYRAFAHLSLSFSDFQALLDLGYSKEQIDNTLDAVENYSGNTKYRNLMTTCRNWLQKDAKPKARTLIETMPTDPNELKAWQADNRRRILGQYEATMGQLEQSIKDEADD